jgi:hypothetical protein
MQRRQMKYFKHVSKTLAKTPKNTRNHCKHPDETLATNV